MSLNRLFKASFLNHVSFSRLAFVLIVIFPVSCVPSQKNLGQMNNLNQVIQIGHQKEISSISPSTDGNLLLTGSWDGTVKLWDVWSGRELRTYKDNTPPRKIRTFQSTGYKNWPAHDIVTHIIFSPTQGQFLSCHLYGISRLWETSSGRLVRTFKGKPSKVMGAAFTSDGQYVVISNFAGELDLWKVNSGKRVWAIQLISKKITSLCFAADNNSFIAGYDDGSLYLHKTENGKIIRRYSGHKDAVISCSFSADGKLVASGSHDESAKVWKADSGTLLETFTEESSVASVRFSSRNNRLLVGCANGTIRIRDPRNWKLLMTFRDKSTKLTSADYIKNEKYIILSYASGELKVLSISSENIIRHFGSTPPPVDHVGYLNNGHLLITARNGIIDVWDTQKCILLKKLNTGTDTITYIDYRSRDENIAFHTPANGMQSINIETGKIRALGQNNAINMNSEITSPDGKFYLTYGMSRYLSKIESGTGNWSKRRRYAGHSKRITCASYSPDGKYALTGSNDKTIIMWNLALGFATKTFLGHDLPVTSVGFSPSQQFIVSGSRDTTTRIWDAKSGKEIVKLISDKSGEWIVATPDGYYNCSPEGSSLLIWVFPNSMEGYSYEQFESAFKRPEVIRDRLSGNSKSGRPAPEIRQPQV